MRAAVLTQPETIVVEDRPTPVPGPDQVLVRVSSVGICGSDVHYYQHGRIGDFVVKDPIILGHEAAGTIEAVGANVTRVQPGQRVAIEPGVPDFTCAECRAGRYNLCPQVEFYATPPFDGAFAELVLAHSAFVYPVPDAVSDDAAALIEPLSVGIWANRKAAVDPSATVLITGAGPIGLVNLQVARARGAGTVYVSDVNEHRLAAAAELGGIPINVGAEPLTAQLSSAPTVVLECSGVPEVVGEAIRALAPAGRAVLIGMGGDEISLPVSAIQNRELSITGVFRYANTWPEAISLIMSGAVDLDRLVTGYFDLDHAADALLAGQQDPQAIKSVVRPNGIGDAVPAAR